MVVDGDKKMLQFVSFSSAIDIGFWHKLTKNKLEKYKLDESPQDISGTFANNDPTGLPCRVNVDYTAFDEGSVVSRLFPSPGQVVIKNTIENFKTCDKNELQRSVSLTLIKDILSGAVEENPLLLTRFLILTFPDLKKYHFYYWFLFPALQVKEHVQATHIDVITSRYSAVELESLQTCYDELSARIGCNPFVFLLKNNENKSFSVGELKDWESFFGNQKKVVIGFSDPSTLAEHPGWPLRNLLTYLLHKRGKELEKLTVICYRDRIRDGKRENGHSLVIDIETFPEVVLNEDEVKIVGWEKNQRDKMGPRMVNLSSSMDPMKLAESATDLNLKLMRWRLIPELNLEKISSTKCLLLGSGTLGCNVARALMGWGVRKITFVDNSKVSYSNPVRQSLFEFEDCLNGGKRKAEAAAAALKKVFPSIVSTGHELTIPMPGHAVPEKDVMRIEEDVQYLEKLISEHDVVFLLMDTRESRWLPGIISASQQKIVINAALGFDTFMVMRHGNLKASDSEYDNTSVKLDKETVRIAGNKLGCYFCNDVVAPGNSTQDRTLDQQCTVSRPGVSMMASAMAVELLVGVLQHPLGLLAPAETSANDNHLRADFETPIGIVPHQIRCFLSRYHTVLPAICAFDKCTGCSPLVIKAYEEQGFAFLLQVFNVPKYLEDLTGLTELQASIGDAEVWELSDDDDDDEEGDEIVA